uniref:Uncharacterized protein n=2 Tax=Ciona intestinalis TaxID=7719 RepID=H2XUK4_CIOIN
MSRSPSPKKHSLRGNEGGRRSMSLSPIRTESGAKLRTANWTKVFRAPAYRDNQHHQRGGWNNRGFNQRYNQRFNYRGGRGNFRGNNWNYNNRYQPQRRYYNRSRSRSRSYSRSRSRDRSRSRSYSPVRKRYSYSRSRSRTRDRSREKSRERSRTPPNKLRTPVNQSKSPVAQPRWDDKPSELPPQPTPSDVIGWNSSDIEVKKEEVTSQEDAGTAAMKMEKIALASIARHEKSLKKIKSKMADDEPEKKKKKKKMKKKSKKMKKSDTDSSDESSESSGSGSSSSPSPAKRKAKKKSKKQRDLRTGDSPKDKGVDDVTMKDKQKAEQPTFPFNFPQMSFPQGGSMQPMMIMPNYEEGKAMMMIAVPGVDGKMTMIPLQQGTQAFQPQPVPPPTNQVSSNVIQIQTDQSEQPEKKELTEKQKRRKEIIRTRLWPRPASSKWEDEDKSEESWPLKVKNSGELPNFDFEEATESFAQNKPGSGRGHIPGFSPDRNQEIGQKIPTLGGSQTFSETSMQEKNENKVSMASEKIESNPIVTRQNLMTTYPTQHIVQHGFDPNYGFGEQQQNQQQNQQPPESKWSVAASDFINERRSVASSTEGEVPSSSSDDQSKKKKSQDLRRKKKRSSLKSPEIDEKSKKKKKKRKDSIGDGDSPVSKE